MPPAVTVVPGSSRKLYQLTGEFDRERQMLTLNRTETRFGLAGTDLGGSPSPGAMRVPPSSGTGSSRARPDERGTIYCGRGRAPQDESMSSRNQLEEGDELALDFTKLARSEAMRGVLPCAVQNVETGEVILVAYVNDAALKAAVATRSAVFWSTSRNELWEKGKTSGETFELVEVRVNCEQNSLLYLVRPRRGGICHTKNQAGQARNCFYRRLDFDSWTLVNLDP